MKKLNYFSALLIILMVQVSCSTRKITSTPQNDFVKSFEKAVLSHSSEAILNHMTLSYVKEQHNEFLQGRTQQFLNEFFCGNLETNKTKFICVKDYTKIKSIETISITQKQDSYIYKFKILYDNEWIIVEQNISQAPSKINTHLGLVGASG